MYPSTMFELMLRGESWRAVRGALGLRTCAGDVLQLSRLVLEVELVEPAELFAGVVHRRTGCAGRCSHGQVGLGGICDEHVARSEL